VFQSFLFVSIFRNSICLCRAVAASDVNKYAWTPALQDNVEIWLTDLKAAYPWTEILWASEWINIKHKLVSLIALAFSVLFDQAGYCMLISYCLYSAQHPLARCSWQLLSSISSQAA